MNFNKDKQTQPTQDPMSELVELIQTISTEEAIEIIKKVKELHEWQTYLRLAQKFEGKDVVKFAKEESKDE